MAQIKGVVFNAWLQFLKSRYGEDEVQDAIQRLAAEQQATMAKPFLDSSWYPYESQACLNTLTRALATSADANLSFEMGRFMADYAFDRVYKKLLSRESNRLVRNAWLEDSLFQGVRTMKSEMIAESTVLIYYHYDRKMKPTPGMCKSTIGFCVRQAELAGGANVKVIHPDAKCAVSGNDCCEVVISWQSHTV